MLPRGCAETHPKTAIYPARVIAASYSRRNTFGLARGIGAWPSSVPKVLLRRGCENCGALANLKRQISLQRELSPWQPLLLDSSVVRSCRANGEDESRSRLLHRSQPGTRLRSPSTVC